VKKVQSLVDERKSLEKRVEEATRGSTDEEVERLLNMVHRVDHVRVIATNVRVPVPDMKTFTSIMDAVRERLQFGVAVLSAEVAGKNTLLCIVTDDLREAFGLRADLILKEVAAVAGGRGGGKAHLAQAGIPDPSRIPAALASVAPTVTKMIESHER